MALFHIVSLTRGRTKTATLRVSYCVQCAAPTSAGRSSPSRLFRSPTFANSARVVADPRILSGAIYSLAMASNIGALSWTISSSLAGLLWVRILQQKGIKVTQVEFARWMVPLMLVLSTVASAIVLVEIDYWNLGTL